MIRRLGIASALALGAGLASSPAPAAPPPATTDAQLDLSIFYSSMAPYGAWRISADFGWVWAPYDVAIGWRPYTTGHWVWVDDCGWTWVADEPWGWAAFHYGRWYYDLEFGWTWVPGPIWAPAWVVWRTGPRYCGWAPVPPSAGWSVGVGFRGGSIGAAIAAHHWAFVATSDFCAPRIHNVVVMPARNVTLVESTSVVGGLRAEGERVVNVGPDVGSIERAAGRRVERARLRDVDRVDAVRVSQPGSGEIAVFRRKLGDAPKDRRPPEPELGLTRGGAASARGDGGTWRREAEELERRQAQEAKRLAEIHEREGREAADSARASELARRHEAELRALRDQHAREKRSFERRSQSPPPRAGPSAPRRPPAPQPPPKPPKSKKKGPPS